MTLTPHPECRRRLQSLATPRNHLAHALAQNGAGLAQLVSHGERWVGLERRLVQPFKGGLGALEHVGGGAVDVGGLAGE